MRRGLVAAVAAAGVLLTACNGSSAKHAAPSKPTTPAPTPTPTPTVKPGLLTLDDLPTGFTTRPLDSRNLPSNLTGCPAVERLLDGGLGEHTQAEFFQPPVGPWIDEAIIRPKGQTTAAETAARIATAIDGCDSVTVTEEGHRVTLNLTKTRAQAQDAHAYTATGTLRGLGLRMDIVLAPAGRTVVLLTNAALAMTMNPGLTTQTTAKALQKAALV